MSRPPPILLDFGAADPPRFNPVDDRVMGGRSLSRLRRTPEGTGIFEGVVSLEDGSGFASVRAVIPDADLSGHAGLLLRVRGDGKRYRLALRDHRRRSGVNHLHDFPTEAGAWEEIALPFSGFQPSLKGHRPGDGASLDASRIRQVGLMIAGGQDGPFRLEVAWIRGWDGRS